MNVLAISSMYPSAAQPVHAVFVEQRIQAIARQARVVVVSPIPWFPLGGLFGATRTAAASRGAKSGAGSRCTTRAFSPFRRS